MNRLRATSLIGAAVALGTAAAVAVSPASRSDAVKETRRANIDALASAKPAASTMSAKPSQLSSLTRKNTRLHTQERLGVPSFVWASPAASKRGRDALEKDPAAAKLTGRDRAEAAARHHLETYASAYGLTRQDIDNARTTSVHDTGRGAKIVKLQQEIDGIEIFREEAAIMMDRDDNLVAISGALTGSDSAPARAAMGSQFGLTASQALAKAFTDLTGTTLDASALRAGAQDAHGYVVLAGSGRGAVEKLREGARAKQVWFRLPDALTPSYYVELEVGDPGSRETEFYSYVISANDGTVLLRNDLSAHAAADETFTYRVWADTAGGSQWIPQDGPQGNAFTPHPDGAPTGRQPTFVAPVDITLRNFPFSRNDPWLPAGSTETVGNNVDAYADLATPDGYQPGFGDFRADLVGPLSFARTYDVTKNPNSSADQIKAAVAQLFYANNFFHDWYYDSGFDENARNAQMDNYGRGGIGGDPIKAEAQDNGGRNNANMSTPADGNRPRMQMYVFDALGNITLKYLTPTDIAATYVPGTPTLGSGSTGWPQQPAVFDVEGSVVYANDGSTALGSVNDGCEAPTATTWAGVSGKIAFVDRGGCNFILKAKNAQTAGAIGVVIANVANSASRDSAPGMAGDGATVVTTPTLSLGYTVAQRLRCKMGVTTDCGTVTPETVVPTIRMTRAAALDRDGTIDLQIVAHEWGHYLTNRLVGNANGLTTQMARGMGEGWSDFVALLMTVREEDRLAAGNDQYQGTYSVAGYTQSGGEDMGLNNGIYYGIRRTAQSTDMTKNGLTFKHIGAGVAKPTSPLLFWESGFGSSGPHQVHNTGEIWSAMLWECYAALLRDTTGGTPRLTFAEARRRMTDYLVASLKMTPTQPTLLEARDAVLAAAYAGDPQDYVLFAQAFAKRGAGESAVGPDRYDTYHQGIVEDFTANAAVAVVGASLAEDTAAACVPAAGSAKDGIIDAGDSGVLTLTIKNIGTTPLTNVTGTVTTTNPKVTIANGGTFSFSANPLSSAIATVSLSLAADAVGEQIIDLDVTWSDDALEPVSIVTRGNYDIALSQSFLDDVEGYQAGAWGASSFGATNTPTPGWVIHEDDVDHHWFKIRNSNQISDVFLVTPALLVGPEPFVFSFKHRYDFEQDRTGGANGFFDGAVVEITTDNGATWTDIGTSIYPRVSATSAVPTAISPTRTGNTQPNPLAGRPAFVGTSPNYATGEWQTVTANLGTAYAGRTVKVRFRTTTDGFRSDTSQHGAGSGWDIDDVAVSGVVNPPFSRRLPQKCGNRAPVATGITSTQTLAERTDVTIQVVASDPDGDTLSFAWTQHEGPAAVITNANTRTPTITTPEVGRAGGTTTFFVTISDGTQKAFLNFPVRINVTNTNRAPVATATAEPVIPEGTLAQLTGSASTDADGDALTYSWVQKAGPTVTLSSATAANPVFAAPQVMPQGATLTFELTVNDGLATHAAEVTTFISNVNKPPRAFASGPATADERTTVMLDGSGSTDEDGDALTVAWTQTAGPTVELSSATAAKPTFVAPEVTGDTALTFRLVAADAAGANPDAASDVTVTIKHVNRAPTANAGKAQTVKPGDVVTLDASASADVDGDTLTYQWAQTSGPTVQLGNRNTANATFKVPELKEGANFTFMLTVKDPAGLTASSSVIVTAGAAAGGCSSTGGGAAPFAAMMLLALAALRRRVPGKR